MLVTGEGLGDDRVAAIREMNDGAEVVLQLRMLVPLVAGIGEYGHWLAGLGEIPAGQIEEMNRLFQDPIAHLLDVVAPAAGALAVGIAPEFDQAVARITDCALVHHLLEPPPER